MNGMGYSKQELAKLLFISESDLEIIYFEEKPKLKIISSRQ